MAKVYLICGRICSGKSYYAANLIEKMRAVILSCDEMTFALFDGNLGEAHDAVSARMERYLMGKAAQIVRAGLNVILDWGFWTEEGRASARNYFAEQQVECEMHYIDTPLDLWHMQIAERNEAVKNGLQNTYIVDEGLIEKLESRFQPPRPDEIDVWYKNQHG